MGYQMRTIQKISKTRSGAVKHIYLPLPPKTPDINLCPIYVVVVGWVDYHTGRYEWKIEFDCIKRKNAELLRDNWYDHMMKSNDLPKINTVAIVKRYRG